MTLKELADKLPTTRGIPKPGKSAIRRSRVGIIVRYPPDAKPEKGVDGIFVYEDGFILYQHTDYACVLRIDACLQPYTHPSLKGEGEAIPLECFMEMDWKIRITLAGEDRITLNRTFAKEENEIPVSGLSGKEATEYKEQLETIEFRKKVMAALTENQCRIYKLYFIEGYTAPEIGRLEGITPRAVLFCLDGIKKKTKKILKTTTD